MLLALFGFLKISIIDILDIILTAGIIYMAFRWIKESSALSIFVALLSLYVIRVVAAALGMKLMTALMGAILDVGVLALIIIFQPEIRKFLARLGNRYLKTTGNNWFIQKIFGKDNASMGNASVNEITEACRRMSESKTGALIVIEHHIPLDDIIDTGDKIDAAIHRRLIMNLFFKNSPLHDGAMIIAEDRIVAARCTLPITDKTDIPAKYGMRHKAAIGISEGTDADVIVVSEETGEISFVKEGTPTLIGNINELKLLLGAAMSNQN